MKAAVLSNPGGCSTLEFRNVPLPQPTTDQVLIRIKAFGLNHAELHMRKGEWAEAAPISGIECVGTVESSPSGAFQKGELVAALMGGLGRTINGSYAEFTAARTSNVVRLGPKAGQLSWEQLAAIPESYATAWTVLFRNLDVRKGETLLVRGATSALGQAAIKLAAEAQVTVIGTTRSAQREALLKKAGATHVLIEEPHLGLHYKAKHAASKGAVDKVLNLIGNSVLLDSLHIPKRGGRVCLAGFLGGLEPVAEFNPLASMVSDVQLSFFGSFVFGEPEFPLDDVPLGEIVSKVATGKIKAAPARVFPFEAITEAQKVLEDNEAGGKVVIVLDDKMP